MEIVFRTSTTHTDTTLYNCKKFKGIGIHLLVLLLWLYLQIWDFLILLQFSAHEFAHLKFESDKTISGNKKHLERLASLLRFAMKWAGSIGVVAFPIILFIGFIILNQRDRNKLDNPMDYLWYSFIFCICK